MRSQQLVNKPHLALRFIPLLLHIRRLQLVRSLPLTNKRRLDRRLAPKALLRKKPLEAKNSLVRSGLTATHCVTRLRYVVTV
jgi:hypothetical protein